MPKAKSYKILKLIKAVLDILKNDPDIANREINTNTTGPETVPTNFYEILPLEYIKKVACPAISVFSDFNCTFNADSSAAEIIDPKIFIDISYENFDLKNSIAEAYMFAEDIRETLKQKKGLNGNVADCRVSNLEEIGADTDSGNPLRFAFRLTLYIKTR